MKKIYLAGFDVFRPDAVEHGDYLKSLCLRHGFEGLYPLDNAAPSDLHGTALAHWICDANLALIRQADAVMANLNAFRGNEPDSGTVFEAGYAFALGKPVWAYADETRSLIGQVAAREVRQANGHTRMIDDEGYTVEDFGMSLNLMLGYSTHLVVGGPEHCLAAMQAAGPSHDG